MAETLSEQLADYRDTRAEYRKRTDPFKVLRVLENRVAAE